MTASSDRAWEVIEKVGVSMLTTRTSSGDLRSRPVEARPNRDEGCLYVVTDLRSAKEHEIERDPHIGLTFIDQQSNAYLAIEGTRDRHHRQDDDQDILAVDRQRVVGRTG